jgi:hypothetical protein
MASATSSSAIMRRNGSIMQRKGSGHLSSSGAELVDEHGP